MSAEEKRILELIEGGRDEIVDLLVELVRIPSRTGEEGEAQRQVEARFRRMGLEVDVFEPDVQELFARYPQIAQYPSAWQPELDLPLRFPDVCTWEQFRGSEYFERLSYRERPNVVGVLRGSGGGRSLILNGHIDVVTEEPRRKWSHDPWGAEIEGDLLYGRGSTDMKGGMAAMIKAVEFLQRAGVRLRGDVVLQSVVNEEHAGNGTLACLARGYTADAAIVTESTRCEGVAVSTGGAAYWEIRIRGREVHTGSRWRDGRMYGISAVEKAAPVIQALVELERRQNAEEPRFSLGLGTIRGGTYATSTALECVLGGVVYFSPAMGTGEEGIRRVKDLLRQAVASASEGDDWLRENPAELLFLHYDDAYRNDSRDGIVRMVQEVGREVAGREILPIGLSACDSRHLANQGGIPTVLYGPGYMGVAHSVDEHISLSQLIEATKVLALAVYRWCR